MVNVFGNCIAEALLWICTKHGAIVSDLKGKLFHLWEVEKYGVIWWCHQLFLCWKIPKLYTFTDSTGNQFNRFSCFIIKLGMEISDTSGHVTVGIKIFELLSSSNQREGLTNQMKTQTALFCIFFTLLPHPITSRKSNHHYNWHKSRTPCFLCKFTGQLFNDLYYSFEWVRHAENGHIYYMTQLKQPNSPHEKIDFWEL